MQKFHPLPKMMKASNPLGLKAFDVVEVTGFEPATFWSRNEFCGIFCP
jgi:hypothetical protein